MYMRGVRSEYLITLVDFLYSGEANVDQESLGNLLDLAAELQLKGLQKTSVNDTKQRICRETNKSEKESDQSLAKGNGNHTILDHSKATNNDATVLTNKDNRDKTDLLDLKQRVKSMMSFSESSAPGKARGAGRVCNICGKEGSWTGITNHIEANHFETFPKLLN